MESLFPILVSGIVLGSLYAMMATGLSLVWSTLGIFNFTHGMLMTLGAYVTWQVAAEDGFGMGLGAGIAVGVAALIGLGCAIERGLVRPFLAHGNVVLSAVITTLAASIFFENGTIILWGPRLKQLPPLVAGQVSIWGMNIAGQDLLIVVLAPAVLVALWLFLRMNRIGKAIRAVAQNRDAALLVGLNVNFLYSFAFSLSAVLAGLVGILLGSSRFVTPFMGNDPMVKALIVAIFGGLGSISGTIGAAYVIGFIEAISTYVVGLYWTPAVLFMIMIVVLVVRPTGLFGRK